MKVSIIIVSYNEKDYLIDAFNSCINQGLKDFEIIFADDGSNDGSLEVIKDLQNKHPNIVRYFTMDRSNIGLLIPSIRCSNVLKEAFKISKGEYIQIMSADDEFVGNEKINRQIAFLDNHKRYKSTYCDYIRYFEEDNSLETNNCPRYLSRKAFIAGQYFHVSCFLFRKECLVNLTENLCDDVGLIYSILVAGKSKHMPFVGFKYRQRKTSISGSIGFNKIVMMEIMLLQDILNSGIKKYRHAMYARIYRPVNYWFKNDIEIPNREEFLKGFKNSTSLIQSLTDKDKKIKPFICKCRFYHYFYRLLFFPYRVFNKLNRIFNKNR